MISKHAEFSFVAWSPYRRQRAIDAQSVSNCPDAFSGVGALPLIIIMIVPDAAQLVVGEIHLRQHGEKKPTVSQLNLAAGWFKLQSASAYTR